MKNARSIRIKGFIGGAVASVALMGAGPAIAGGGAVESEMTLKKAQGFAWKGVISSDKGVCEKSRDVTVFRKEQGDDVSVGGDKTDSGGKYRAEVNQFSVDTPYYATTPKVEKGDVTCAKVTSPIVKVQD